MKIVRSTEPAGPRPWHFELITPAGEVCGGGVVIAPTASSARTHARLLLAGCNDVRIVPSPRDAVAGMKGASVNTHPGVNPTPIMDGVL